MRGIHTYYFLLRNLSRIDNRVVLCAVVAVLESEGVVEADVSSSFSNSATCVEFVSSLSFFFRFDMKRNKDADFTTVGEADEDSFNVDPFVFVFVVVVVIGDGGSLPVLASRTTSSSSSEEEEGKTLLPRIQ